jgi:hypothetical protein
VTSFIVDHSGSKSLNTPFKSIVDIFGVILSVNKDQIIVLGGTGLLAWIIDDFGCQWAALFNIE